MAAARERLTGLSRAGVGAILDMTVPGLYRDPALVARAAEGTGLKVMFATGYYTYDNLPFPFHYRGRGKIIDDEDRTLESLFERDVTTGILRCRGTTCRACRRPMNDDPATSTNTCANGLGRAQLPNPTLSRDRPQGVAEAQCRRRLPHPFVIAQRPAPLQALPHLRQVRLRPPMSPVGRQLPPACLRHRLNAALHQVTVLRAHKGGVPAPGA